MYIGTLLESLTEIFLLILVGYFIRKKKILSEAAFTELSQLLILVVMPLSIISSGTVESSLVSGMLMLKVAGVGFCYYLFAFIISIIIYRFAGESEHREVNTTMSIFANTGFIGLPLTKVLYGSEGLLFAVVFNLLYNVFFFTWGTKILGKGKERVDFKRIITDPLTIASVLAIGIFSFSVPIPSVILSPMKMIGDMTVPISMFIIGGDLVGLNVKRAFTNVESYLIVAIRLIVFPLIVLVLMKMSSFPDTMKATIVLLASLPVGSLNAIFAKKYEYDFQYVNETMILSMIFSAITVSLFIMIV